MRQVQSEGRIAVSRRGVSVEGVVSPGLAHLRQQLLLRINHKTRDARHESANENDNCCESGGDGMIDSEHDKSRRREPGDDTIQKMKITYGEGRGMT